MKVFITGATGLIGAHTAKELLTHGHQVKLLVRDQRLARKYFSKFSFDISDYVIADMRDKQAIRHGLQGCDAVVHAAAMVSLESKNAAETYQTNVDGVKSVIGEAVNSHIPNILYVSSLNALFYPQAKVINESSRLGNLRGGYSKSKIDCEKYVRSLQELGAPIQITYPSAVFGPDDPRLSEANQALLKFITHMVPITSSGLQVVDVRDVAIAHYRMLVRGCPKAASDGRLILGGNFCSWSEILAVLESIVGHELRSMKISGYLLRLGGHVCDMLRRIHSIEFPMTAESMLLATQWVKADSSKVLNDLDLDFRSTLETFSETINWLKQAEHLK